MKNLQYFYRMRYSIIVGFFILSIVAVYTSCKKKEIEVPNEITTRKLKEICFPSSFWAYDIPKTDSSGNPWDSVGHFEYSLIIDSGEVATGTGWRPFGYEFSDTTYSAYLYFLGFHSNYPIYNDTLKTHGVYTFGFWEIDTLPDTNDLVCSFIVKPSEIAATYSILNGKHYIDSATGLHIDYEIDFQYQY